MLILLSSKLATAKIILCALWPEVKKYTISEKKNKISLQSLFPWASMEIRVPKVLEKLHADEDTVRTISQICEKEQTEKQWLKNQLGR